MRPPYRSSAWLLALAVSCSPSDKQGVEETGYFNGGQVVYSAAAPLSANEQELLLVGLPGALGLSGGTLTVTGPRGQASLQLDDPQGRFVVTLGAALQDTLELRYELDGGDPPVSMLRLTLSDALDRLVAPALMPGTGILLLEPTPEGVEVNLSALEMPAPPYVVLNQRTTDFALAEQLELVTLPGQTGDTICVFQLDRSMEVNSPTYCETVP